MAGVEEAASKTCAFAGGIACLPFCSWFPIRNSHFAIRNQSRCSLASALSNCNFFGREVVEFIDEPVDLAVERGAFAFVVGPG